MNTRQFARFLLATGILACAIALMLRPAAAQDITAPGNTITATSANSPVAEQVPKAIDNQVSTKYLNFDKLNTGFTVTPSGSGPVTGLGLISANDAPERDPASFTLEGSNDGVIFNSIAAAAVPAFNSRFAVQEFGFANATNYSQYRVLFPTVQNAGAANSMQIAEVQLLKALDVTTPGNTVVPTSNNIPAGEEVTKAIDNNVNTNYLNFDKLNTGLTVTPTQPLTIVRALGLIAANDAPERDPASYLLEGSLNGVTFSTISQGPVAVFPARFATQEIAFPNNTAYSIYRLTFPTVVNAGTANSMQIAEVQLYGVVPEPATIILAAFGLAFLGVAGRRVSRR